MSTEQDVYIIVTAEAVANLLKVAEAHKEVGEEVDSSKKKHESFADFIQNDMKKAFLTAEAQYDLLKEAMKEGIEFAKEAIEAKLEEDKALRRLSFTLKNAGVDSKEWTEHLHEQAEGIEKVTGMSSEHIMAMQAMAVSMGVAAEDVERLTKVSVDLAALNNADVIPVMRALARASAEGKEELKKYGIVMENITDDSGGFAAVLAEAEKRTAGLSEQLSEQEKTLNELKHTWDDVKKWTGGILLDLIAQNQQLHMFMVLKKAVEALTSSGEAPLPPPMTMKNLTVTKPEVDTKGHEAARKKNAEENKKFFEKLAEDYIKLQQEMKQADQDFESTQFTTWKAAGDASKEYYGDLKKLSDDDVTRAQEAAEQERDFLRRSEDAHVASLERKRAAQEAFWNSMLRQAEEYTQQIVGVGVNALGDELMANTEFNRQMFELQLERDMAADGELDATKARAKMEGKIRDDKIATFEKELAASLMTMAKDAAVKSLWEGAQALASAASYEYEAAGQHAIAASLFAGVAVTAGGAAAGINSVRGMTAEESGRLEDARKADKEKKDKDAKQSAQRGSADGGQQINVYYMGIAGTTELEQARELERIHGRFNKLKTGSK